MKQAVGDLRHIVDVIAIGGDYPGNHIHGGDQFPLQVPRYLEPVGVEIRRGVATAAERSAI